MMIRCQWTHPMRFGCHQTLINSAAKCSPNEKKKMPDNFTIIVIINVIFVNTWNFTRTIIHLLSPARFDHTHTEHFTWLRSVLFVCLYNFVVCYLPKCVYVCACALGKPFDECLLNFVWACKNEQDRVIAPSVSVWTFNLTTRHSRWNATIIYYMKIS